MSETLLIELCFKNCLPLVYIFLAIPVMFEFFDLLKLVKFGFHFTGKGCHTDYQDGCGICYFTYCYQILMGYIKKHNFIVFGWYRIILGAILLLCGIAGASLNTFDAILQEEGLGHT